MEGLLALVVPAGGPARAAWGLAAALLLLHVAFRVRAQRLALDEEGKPAPFRLRLWPLDHYRGEEAVRWRNLVLWSGFLFMAAAVAAMVFTEAEGR